MATLYLQSAAGGIYAGDHLALTIEAASGALGSVSRKTVATTPLCEIACSLVEAGTGVAIVDSFSASGF